MIFHSLVIFHLIFLVEINCLSLGRVFINELFTKKIEPKMFNWTYGQPEQFKYTCSLKGYPDLPSWMRYMYNTEYNSGYLYGTPPEHLSGQEIRIDIVGLNKLNYDTKRITLSLFITRKSVTSKNAIHMKIDNLDWVHLMDPGRVEDLKNIFKNELWPESRKDLHIIFMESAIKMGGRIPLHPQHREGVIVHLGSTAEFSSKLIDLQKEVKPLYKITSCTYKRTSVQTIFEDAGFKIDWCAFRIVDSIELITRVHGSEKSILTNHDEYHWEPMTRSDVPQRNYIDEIAITIAIPSILFAVLVGMLSAILCFYHEKIHDEISEVYFANIFHICTDWKRNNQFKSKCPVQMVQYSNPTTQQQPKTATLRSLKDPSCSTDNLSVQSNSPGNTNNYQHEDSSPRGNSTLRPRPPPYKPSTVIYKNGVDI